MDLSTLLNKVEADIKKVIQLSHEQQAVLDAFVSKWSNIAIQAAAGSGKTFMVEQMINEANKIWPDIRMAYFVFNKSAQLNAVDRLHGNVDIRTFHSLGMRLINRYIRMPKKLPPFAPNSPAQVSETATMQFMLKKIKSGDYGFLPHPEEDKTSWPKLYNLAYLIGFGKTYNVKNVSELQKVALKHSINTDDGALDNALRVMRDIRREVSTARRVRIDYDDMMYLAANIDPTTIRNEDKYRIVFVDEGQDASVARKTLMSHVLAEGGRVVMVGDINQAIYGFAGSDSANFRTVLESEEYDVLPITTCRRCSKAVIAYASEYDPKIKALPDAPEGEVKDVTSYVDTITTKDAILCRNNAPLFAAYFKLLKAGIPAVIKGVDTLNYLVSLIKDSGAKTNTGLQKFLDDQLLLDKNSAKKEAGDKISLQDAADCIIMCMEEATKRMTRTGRGGRVISTPDDFVKMWKGILYSMFKPNGEAVELSTIHKAKGDEWESVYWIGSHLMPSPLAKQPWEIVEEHVNLPYVLITRAKLNFYKVVH